jgi:hypothetical protein
MGFIYWLFVYMELVKHIYYRTLSDPKQPFVVTINMYPQPHKRTHSLFLVPGLDAVNWQVETDGSCLPMHCCNCCSPSFAPNLFLFYDKSMADLREFICSQKSRICIQLFVFFGERGTTCVVLRCSQRFLPFEVSHSGNLNLRLQIHTVV